MKTYKWTDISEPKFYSTIPKTCWTELCHREVPGSRLRMWVGLLQPEKRIEPELSYYWVDIVQHDVCRVPYWDAPWSPVKMAPNAIPVGRTFLVLCAPLQNNKFVRNEKRGCLALWKVANYEVLINWNWRTIERIWLDDVWKISRSYDEIQTLDGFLFKRCWAQPSVFRGSRCIILWMQLMAILCT